MVQPTVAPQAVAQTSSRRSPPKRTSVAPKMPPEAFSLVKVRGDGNCLFTAVAAGLFGSNGDEAVRKGRILREKVDSKLCGTDQLFAALVESAARQMHEEVFGVQLLPNTNATSFRSYCNNTRKATAPAPYGNDAVVLALSKLYRRRIVVYRKSTSPDLEVMYDTYNVFGDDVADPPIYLQLQITSEPHYDLLVLKKSLVK